MRCISIISSLHADKLNSRDSCCNRYFKKPCATNVNELKYDLILDTPWMNPILHTLSGRHIGWLLTYSRQCSIAMGISGVWLTQCIREAMKVKFQNPPELFVGMSVVRWEKRRRINWWNKKFDVSNIHYISNPLAHWWVSEYVWSVCWAAIWSFARRASMTHCKVHHQRNTFHTL